jgi:PAS domain S-box-containing protein
MKEDGKTIGIQAIARDITERKKAKEEIRLLSNIVQQTSEAIAVSDLAGKLVFSNSAWADMHGYEMKELAEKDVSIFYQKPEIVRLFEGKARSEGFVRGRIVHIRKNGSTFTTLSLLSLLKDERGKPMGIARTAKDIRRIVLDIRDVGILPKLAS